MNLIAKCIICVLKHHFMLIFIFFIILIIILYRTQLHFITNERMEQFCFCSDKFDFAEYSKVNQSLNKSVTIRKWLNLPCCTSVDYGEQLKVAKRGMQTRRRGKMKSQKILEIISAIIQEQLKVLQTAKNCIEPNILCGSHLGCGFGCQIHDKIGCIVISYTLGLPVIIDETDWSYMKPWNDVFLPFGSNCKPGNNTFVVKFDSDISVQPPLNGVPIGKDKFYPLEYGLIAFKEFADLVELNHPFPFIWWFGQFVKFGLKLNHNMTIILAKTKKELQFRHPIVGIHVRRTDKIVEDINSAHHISLYMKKVEEIFETKLNISENKNVFVASDDATVLNETKLLYPKSKNWNIIGFSNRQTYSNLGLRIGALDEIVLDLFLLSECDFIVCGFSSNICRLLLAMMNYQHFDGMERFDGTLDGKYIGVFGGYFKFPPVVFKLD